MGKIERPSIEGLIMDFATSLTRRATCKRFQVGSVITSEDMTQIYAFGYNGTAKGFPHDDCKADQPGGCGCVHSEQNALIKVRTNDPRKVVREQRGIEAVLPERLSLGRGARHHQACRHRTRARVARPKPFCTARGWGLRNEERHRDERPRETAPPGEVPPLREHGLRAPLGRRVPVQALLLHDEATDERVSPAAVGALDLQPRGRGPAPGRAGPRREDGGRGRDFLPPRDRPRPQPLPVRRPRRPASQADGALGTRVHGRDHGRRGPRPDLPPRGVHDVPRGPEGVEGDPPSGAHRAGPWDCGPWRGDRRPRGRARSPWRVHRPRHLDRPPPAVNRSSRSFSDPSGTVMYPINHGKPTWRRWRRRCRSPSRTRWTG
ncbi:MAG: hypothetical protein E6K17_05690 [Methanobacteriota archaeon]|nr:MAG: hypothetical protein E6K17_05690 [Euryarchaeota archaeon]